MTLPPSSAMSGLSSLREICVVTCDSGSDDLDGHFCADNGAADGGAVPKSGTRGSERLFAMRDGMQKGSRGRGNEGLG